MISLTPAAYTDTVKRLLRDVPKNLQYLSSVVDVVIPYELGGSGFILVVSETFIPVEVNIERPLEPESNVNKDQRILFIPESNTTQIRLPLSLGINTVRLTSELGDVSIRIGVANWTTWLYTFGNEIDNKITTRLQNREDSILSPTGSILVERWFEEADLLPKSNSMHRLAMRMVVDAYRHPSTNSSVLKIAAAMSGNNPIVKHRALTDRAIRHGTVLPSFSDAIAGYEFHMWFTDMCISSFITAGKYIENFNNIWDGIRWGESSIVYESGTDRHLLISGNGAGGCSIEDKLLREGCFDNFRPFVSIRRTKSFVMCLASYPFDTSVEVCNALGAVYWDCDNLTMEETINDPNLVDEEDPTGDGWVGHSLDGRFDYPFGGSTDTYGIIEDFMSSQCPYTRGPVATPLSTFRIDTHIDVNLVAFGTFFSAPLPGAGAIFTLV